MADGPNGAPTGATSEGGASPTAAKGPPLTVRTQYLKDMSFENPGAPATLMPTAGPKVALSVDVNAKDLGDQGFEVVLMLRAEAKRDSDEVIFLGEVQYAGVFSMGEGVAKEHVQLLLLIEAPRLLFPYARSILTNSIRDGGFPPLTIQPIDFLALYQQRVAHMKQQQQQGAPQPASPAPAAAPETSSA